MNNIMSAIFILASLGMFFFYVRPQYSGVTGSSTIKEKSIKELKDDQLKYDAALEKTREIERVKNGLVAKYNAITKKNRDDIIKFLPDHIDSVRLILDINSVASKYGMAVKNITLKEPASGGKRDSGTIGPNPSKFSSVTLGFTTSGSYDDLVAFVRDLETSLRVMDIISISFDEVRKETNSHEFKISLKTYRLNRN